MSVFVCPVCSKPLDKDGSSLRCENRHCYDIAKQGYVNLLMSQKSSAKRHGDDKLMVASRRDFLDKGYYLCLRDALCDTAVRFVKEKVTALDAGCGEGWYTYAIAQALEENGAQVRMAGIDISKQALIYAAKRSKKIELAAAGVFNLPLAGSSCDMVFNVFAPCAPEEFSRVLSDDGVLIRAVPLENHLLAFKEHIYDNVYPNKVEDFEVNGFRLLEKQEIRKTLTLDNNEDIMNLFRMTPYYYKTSTADQAKVAALARLETQLEFGVLVYSKI
ncbi:MAG: methyltransferase domain-containing protein [Clostridia bacterium]|nr:methyltransferase domain-containing protein [Clostridia bacterium]